MNKQLYEKLNPRIKKACRRVVSEWPAMVTAEDLEQELWVFLLETKSAMEFFNNTVEARLIEQALYTKATSIASKMRLDYDRFQGNWFYSVKEVKQLMWNIREGHSIPIENRLDLEHGLCKLTNLQYERVWDYTYGTDAENTGGSRKRVSKAFTALVTHMNIHRSCRMHAEQHLEGPGTRPSPTERKQVYDY